MKRIAWQWFEQAAAFLLALGAVWAASAFAAPRPKPRNAQSPALTPEQVEARVNSLLSRMTLAEKIGMIGGVKGFYTEAIPRLGIPSLRMSDGPMGLRNQEPSTAFPAGITLAASWNPQLADRIGQAMGLEARARGVNILLAPGVNIQRVSVDGRNFEFYGEDPYLAGRIAAEFVRGVQSEGVIATVKHFAANNQETNRGSINEIISERALHEIYLPAFRAAIDQGHAWAVMAAYNRVNGDHAAENKVLLTDILRKRWGFKGLVMSDWGAAHKGVKAALAGLDLEMPSPRYMNAKTLLPAIQSGKIPMSVINDKVRRILRAAISMGFFDRPQLEPDLSRYSGASSLVALRGAQEGIVLLRNQNQMLPLDAGRIHSIAVFGPNANPAVTGGGGSSHVVPFRATSVLEGLVELAEPRIRVDYMPFPPIQEPATGGPYAAEQALAAKDDVAVVCVGFDEKTEGEGFDRTFTLPKGQNSLIEAVAKANPRTIVVLNSGGAVDMTAWIHQIGALLEAWYPGQEGGRAVAQILFGQVNPSGKLPATFEKKWGDAEAEHYYPGKNGTVEYKEGIFVGYRWFDHADIQPLFPFGFGLSYSTFAFSHLALARQGSSVNVSFDLKNTSERAGAEVAQVYIHPVDPKVVRTVKTLKGFARVELAPGKTQHVEITLPQSAFAYYDTAIHNWRVPSGEYEILIGSSSRDLPLKESLTLH
jgi:beta-glucosidase